MRTVSRFKSRTYKRCFTTAKRILTCAVDLRIFPSELPSRRLTPGGIFGSLFLKATATMLAARLKALPRPVWILFFGTFLNKFGTFVIPFLTLYLTARGYSVAQAGAAISAYGVGCFVAAALVGHLADSLGRRNTIIFSMFSTAIAMMLLSRARNFPAILAMTFFVAATGELYRPASSALLADLVPEGERVTAYSAYRMSFNAGWAFGPATAGFLAGHSYDWLFIGDAATSVLFGIVAWVALPHGLRASRADAGWRPALRVIARDRRFLRLLAASLAIAFVFMQMSSTFSLHVKASGFSATTYGALISFNGLLVVICEMPLTTLTQRFPTRRVMALGYVFIAAGFALNAIANTLPLLAVGVFIFTVGEMIAMPVSSAYVADLAPAQFRGRYSGFMALVWALAVTVGPNLGMTFFSHSPTVFWLGCGGLGLLAALIIISGRELK
jgi:MFS family permease